MRLALAAIGGLALAHGSVGGCTAAYQQQLFNSFTPNRVVDCDREFLNPKCDKGPTPDEQAEYAARRAAIDKVMHPPPPTPAQLAVAETERQNSAAALYELCLKHDPICLPKLRAAYQQAVGADSVPKPSYIPNDRCPMRTDVKDDELLWVFTNPDVYRPGYDGAKEMVFSPLPDYLTRAFTLAALWYPNHCDDPHWQPDFFIQVPLSLGITGRWQPRQEPVRGASMNKTPIPRGLHKGQVVPKSRQRFASIRP